MKRKCVFLAVFSAASAVLSLLPDGVAMYWGHQNPDGTIGLVRKTYPYFSTLPAAYGNVWPLLTGILSCLLSGISLAGILTGRAGKGIRGVSAAAFAASVAAMAVPCVFLAEHYVSVPSVVIPVLLGTSARLACGRKG